MITNFLRKFLIISFFISIFLSCDFCNEKDTEPTFKANIVWRSDTKIIKRRMGTQEDKYLYLYEDAAFDDINFDFRLVKIDMETGETVWRTDDFPTTQSCEPVIIANMVYVAVRESLIYCIDKNLGEIKSIIQPYVHNEELNMRENLTAHNNHLYFGFGNGGIGKNYLARINTDDLNLTEAEQMIESEIVWTSIYGNSPVTTTPVFKDDIVFIMTFTWNTNNITEFAAVNILNKEVVWEKMIDDIDGRGHLFINDNTIYIMSQNIIAYRISDGVHLFTKVFSKQFLVPENYAPGLSSRGTVFFNNNLYYTNANSSMGGRNSAPNIVCINASNGSTVWGALPKNSESFGHVPVIHNEKLFFPYTGGLLVYDAITGKLLGVDNTSFALNGNQGTMFLYNDLLIFPDAKQLRGLYQFIAIDISDWK